MIALHLYMNEITGELFETPLEAIESEKQTKKDRDEK